MGFTGVDPSFENAPPQKKRGGGEREGKEKEKKRVN